MLPFKTLPFDHAIISSTEHSSNESFQLRQSTRQRRWPTILLTVFLLTIFLGACFAHHRTKSLRSATNIVQPGLVRCSSTKLFSHKYLDPLPRVPIHSTLRRTLFKEYIPWHRKQRQCLEDGLSNCAPVFVWTCSPLQVCSGAGDRIRAILFTYVLAVATHRVFLIHWANPGALTYAMRPTHIDWTLPPSLVNRLRIADNGSGNFVYLNIPTMPWFLCNSQSGHRCDGVKRGAVVQDLPDKPLNPLLTKAKNGSLNLESDDVEARLNSTNVLGIATRLMLDLQTFLKNPHLRKPLVGQAHANDVLRETSQDGLARMIMHAMFAPTEALEMAMEKRRSALGASYSAVHARLGRDLGENQYPRFRVLNRNLTMTAQAVMSCLMEARQKRVQGFEGGRKRGRGKARRRELTKSVYLATDANDFKEVFEAVSKEKGFKLTMSHGRALHVATQSASFDCEHYLEVFADMWLLARSDVLVGLPSGFANAAAYLGNSEVYGQTFYNESGAFRCVIN